MSQHHTTEDTNILQHHHCDSLKSHQYNDLLQQLSAINLTKAFPQEGNGMGTKKGKVLLIHLTKARRGSRDRAPLILNLDGC